MFTIKEVTLPRKDLKEMLVRAYDKGFVAGYNDGYAEAKELVEIKEEIKING